jgi:acetyl esterase/lipase
LGFGPSAVQSFRISAINLTDSIRLSTSNNDYEISLNADAGFVSGSNVINLEPTEGAITTTIFVRLKAGLGVGTYNNTSIILSSTDAVSKNVICNGSVTSMPVFTLQPKDTVICSGNNASFIVDVSVANTIIWQRSTDGTNWVDITANLDAGTTYSGFTTNNLVLSGSVTNLNYNQYRAITTNAISNAAALSVSPSTANIGLVTGASSICLGNTTTYTCSSGGSVVVDNINPDNFLVPKFSNVTVTSNVAYAAPNGSFHLVDVYQPTGDTTTKRPAVMFLHGGGFRVGNDKSQSYVVSFCTYLAKCGYVAFAPNYNVGGGHTFAQNLAAVKDADLCMNWIRANGATYKYDANYLFEGGGSAGAHLSCNWMLSDNGLNYQGYVVNLDNIIAFANCWGSSPDADRLYNYNSLNNQSMPVFIVQGSADQTVPIQESRTLNNYLSAAGAYVNFWEIPGETHGCSGHIGAISDTMARFFNRAWKRRGTAVTTTGNATGGAWSSSNINVATVNASTGVVSGVGSGTAIITYTIPNCSSAVLASKTISVTTGATSTQTINACTSYSWNGSNYTTSGTYTWHGTSSIGCDSTAVLNLTIKQRTSSTQTFSSCSSYLWNGATYTSSGTFTWTGTNAAGCDSTATLVLTITGGPSATTVNANSFICSGTDAVFYVNGTNNALLLYNINGGSNQTTLIKNGTAVIVNPNTISNTTLNLISVTNPITNCTTSLNTNSIINVGTLNSSVYWNCTTASSNNSNNAISVSNITQGNNNGTTAMISASSASSGYAGASGGNNLTASARTGVLNVATNGSAYFSFIISSLNTNNFKLSAISFGSRSTSTGPIAFSLRNSIDNYSSSIASDTLANNSTWVLKSKTGINVSASVDTFRIYGYNGTGTATSGTSNWRVDDITLTLSIPNPNPTTAVATSNQTICNSLLNYSLVANTPTIGIGTWSQISGPGTTTFGNVHESNTTSSVTIYGTYVYRWTISNGCSNTSTSDVTIVYKNNTRIETVIACDTYTWHDVTYTTSTNTPVFVKTNSNDCDSLINLNLTVNSCSVDLHVKLFLEGMYIGNGLMRSNIYDLELSNNSNETDSVNINLWNTENLLNNNSDYSSTVVLHNNGIADFILPNNFIGKNYYVSVKHRNSVETWSSVPLLLGTNNFYDFTTSQNKAFSDGINLPMKTMNDGKCAFYSGDINQDGGIDISDMQTAENDAANFQFGYYPSDCNGDMSSDISDMQIIENNNSLFIFSARPY